MPDWRLDLTTIGKRSFERPTVTDAGITPEYSQLLSNRV